MPDSILSRFRIVLYEPQDPVNIAGTIRAMKNMGFSRLYLVRPVEYDAYRLEGIAHDTVQIISDIKRCAELEEALDGCVSVAGFTARRRAAKRDVVTPRAAAADLLELAGEGDVALLFGREDKGLPNEILDRAHIVVTIPTTDHASLNLAQAVLLGVYELHVAAADATRTLAPPRKDAPPATTEEYEQLFADAELGLYAIDFFQDALPRAHHALAANHLFSRASGWKGTCTAARRLHRDSANCRAHSRQEIQEEKSLTVATLRQTMAVRIFRRVEAL